MPLVFVLVLALCVAFIGAVLAAIWKMIESAPYVRERWENPKIRSWWIRNGIVLGVALGIWLVIELTASERVRERSFYLVLAVGFLLRTLLRVEQSDRPDELGPVPESFPGLKKGIRRLRGKEMAASDKPTNSVVPEKPAGPTGAEDRAHQPKQPWNYPGFVIATTGPVVALGYSIISPNMRQWMVPYGIVSLIGGAGWYWKQKRDEEQAAR